MRRVRFPRHDLPLQGSRDRSKLSVLSLTFAQTSANEIRSCAVYDSMASLEANGPALKEAVASIMPLLAEGGFERAVGEVVVEA